ncbi:MAG TPA: S41 family peptidase [Gemmatimonadaceae bacterium]|nr:S41 family peptidase [Gemmatimonadaceae bacterium]
MSIRTAIVRLAAFVALFGIAGSAEAQTKLLRFPAIHGDRITFTYGGDLWTASAGGGTATRLTTHPGLELFAHFSPDGQWIAFTGQYEGDEQVYVVPSFGGSPKQLTFYPSGGPRAERWGYDNQVYGWTNDGSRILFRASRGSWTLSQTRLYTVSPNGGSAVPLPMPLAGSGAYSPDGKKIVYSKVFRDFRPEKRYSGGLANYLAIFDFAGNSAKTITRGPRSERDAMWIGDKIYYNSDKDGTFNIYAYDVPSGTTTQLTHSTTWDVRWPSADPQTGKIIYELAGELSILDTKTGQSTPIHVNVIDDGVNSRPSRVSASGQVESFGLSPKGERAVFAARGDIFTAPIEHGYTRNLTHSSGAHDRDPQWSPDGTRVAFISDMSGEEEIYSVAQDGQSKPVQLTSGGKAQYFSPRWSADNSRIAFSDKDGRLFVLRVADKDVKEIAKDIHGNLFDYTWSAAGSNLAWSMTDSDGVSQSVYVWTGKDGGVHRVTGPTFNEYSPAWDPSGNFIYYLSDRDYQPQLSTIEFNYATARTTGIFALALRKDVKHPFPMESDEVTIDTAAKSRPKPAAAAAPAPEADKAKNGKDAVTPETSDIRIDFDGIASRAVRVPVEADNITDLYATKEQIIYTVQGAPYYGRSGERRPSLNTFNLKDRKTALLLDNAPSYSFSADRKRVMVQAGGYGVYDVQANAAASRKGVSTDGLIVDRVPRDEWNQIFDEVWRRYRDYFYVKNMHGYDWKALHDQYKPLVQYVAHRADLNYVIQEMISELSVQHTYISGGDWQQTTRVPVALAGALFTLDSARNRYRISKIFAGENEEPNYRSPLTELGVNAKVGDYVLAIDGEDLKPTDDPYRMLRGKTDRPVTLTLSSSADGSGSRQVTYRPVGSENDLNYLDMVLANQRRVAELSGGKVGYIHIPDMGASGLREFIKWYYPQIRKEGLVIDVRANGGGNVSRMLIERLRRELLGVNFARTDERPNTYPDQVFVGPMATILDEYSSSDGDIFPYMVRQAKLGPLVGKRSWGGVVGISGGVPLIDGGSISVPGSGLASVDGQWVIEGHGVDPDVEVENDASSVLAGKDPQLERAVQEVMKQMATKRHTLPPRPADKVRTRTDQ